MKRPLIQLVLSAATMLVVVALPASAPAAELYDVKIEPRAAKSAIACAAPNQPHYRLVYAVPKGLPDRYATMAPRLANAAMLASSFVQKSARVKDSASNLRLRFLCDSSGRPLVRRMRLSYATRDLRTSSKSLLTDLEIELDGRSGWGGRRPGDNSFRAIMLYDGPAKRPWMRRTRVSTLGGGIAVVQPTTTYVYTERARYAFTWSRLLRSIVWSHGVDHPGQPHFDARSGGCLEAGDIACGSGATGTARCRYIQLDCGFDDVFDPAPEPGSYLASATFDDERPVNFADPRQWFLDRGDGIDRRGPFFEFEARTMSASASALTWTWAPPIDDSTGPFTYEVDLFTTTPTGERLEDVTTTVTGPSFSVANPLPDHEYALDVTPIDPAGNKQYVSSGGILSHAWTVDDVAPGMRSAGYNPTYERLTPTSLRLRWPRRAFVDTMSGVKSIQVFWRRGGTTFDRRDFPFMRRLAPSATYLDVGRLVPGSTYYFVVTASDRAGLGDNSIDTEAGAGMSFEVRMPSRPR